MGISCKYVLQYDILQMIAFIFFLMEYGGNFFPLIYLLSVCVYKQEREWWIQYSLNVLSLLTFSFLPPRVHASFDSIRDVNFQRKPPLADLLFPGGIALCTEKRVKKRNDIDQLGGEE